MPHILLDGYNENSNIKQMNMHVNIQFSPAYFNSIKCDPKLNEVVEKLSQVIAEYFPDHSVEVLSNHDYNTLKNRR